MIDLDRPGHDVERNHRLAFAEGRLPPPRSPGVFHRQRNVRSNVTVQRQRQDAGIGRPLRQRDPHIAIERAQPQQAVRRQPRVGEGDRSDSGLEPQRSRNVRAIDRPAPHVGRERAPKRADGELAFNDLHALDHGVARQADDDIGANRGVGRAGGLHDAHLDARRRFVDRDGQARQVLGERRATLDLDFGVGPVPAFEPDVADGDLDRQRAAGRKRNGAALAIGGVGGDRDERDQQGEPHARIILSGC